MKGTTLLCACEDRQLRVAESCRRLTQLLPVTLLAVSEVAVDIAMMLLPVLHSRASSALLPCGAMFSVYDGKQAKMLSWGHMLTLHKFAGHMGQQCGLCV